MLFPRRTIKNLAFGIAGTLPLLALVIWGWGDWTTFFSNPARTGVIILAFAGAIGASIATVITDAIILAIYVTAIYRRKAKPDNDDVAVNAEP